MSSWLYKLETQSKQKSNTWKLHQCEHQVSGNKIILNDFQYQLFLLVNKWWRVTVKDILDYLVLSISLFVRGVSIDTSNIDTIEVEEEIEKEV